MLTLPGFSGHNLLLTRSAINSPLRCDEKREVGDRILESRRQNLRAILLQPNGGFTGIAVYLGWPATGSVEQDRALSEDQMHTVILLAVLHGFVSIPPIRTFQPFPDVKCPAGYSVWWPQGKEFDNDRFAECIKPIHAKGSSVIKNASIRTKVTSKK